MFAIESKVEYPQPFGKDGTKANIPISMAGGFLCYLHPVKLVQQFVAAAY